MKSKPALLKKTAMKTVVAQAVIKKRVDWEADFLQKDLEVMDMWYRRGTIATVNAMDRNALVKLTGLIQKGVAKITGMNVTVTPADVLSLTREMFAPRRGKIFETAITDTGKELYVTVQVNPAIISFLAALPGMIPGGRFLAGDPVKAFKRLLTDYFKKTYTLRSLSVTVEDEATPENTPPDSTSQGAR